jgi:DNA polymerase-4
MHCVSQTIHGFACGVERSASKPQSALTRQTATRVIHLDADAFFVSVEQAADARLRGKAVAVGGGERGVICSAGYKARRYGVYAPMPVARAKRLCPSLIVLQPDFEKYELFSRLLFSHAKEFTPLVEKVSIDEGYFDVSGHRAASAREIAERLRTQIAESLKLPVSQGIGSNKLVAQIASKLHKPFALFEVPAGAEREFLAPLPNHWLPGVGPLLSKILDDAGLRTIAAIAETPVQDLALIAGRLAPALRAFARGHDERPVTPEHAAAQSFSAQETFAQDMTDETFVRATLRTLADRVFRRVREEGMCVRTIEVRVRYTDFTEARRSRSLPEPVCVENAVYGTLDALLRAAWERRVALRLIALRLQNIYPAARFGELALTPPAQNPEILERIAQATDTIRARFGPSAILRGHDLWLRSNKARTISRGLTRHGSNPRG